MPTTTPAMSATIHLTVDPPREADGWPVRAAIWSRTTYLDAFEPRLSLYGPHGLAPTPDPIPDWVPQPPSTWLAITDQLLAGVTA